MIATRPFGRTGHQSTCTIFGAAAFRAEHVDGLATFACDGHTILLARPRPAPEDTYALPWTGRTVRLVA